MNHVQGSLVLLPNELHPHPHSTWPQYVRSHSHQRAQQTNTVSSLTVMRSPTNEILLLEEARAVPGSALARAQEEETSYCSQRKHPAATVNTSQHLLFMLLLVPADQYV